MGTVMTMEQLGMCEPEPDPTPLPKRGRRVGEYPDDWQKGQDQYEAQLDRMGEA